MSELIRAKCPKCDKVNIFTDYGEFENRVCDYCKKKSSLDDWRDNDVQVPEWKVRGKFGRD